MSLSGHESSSDESYVDNGNFNGRKVVTKKLPPGKLISDVPEGSTGDHSFRSNVKNAVSSETLKDDKGWILWTKEEDELLMKAVSDGAHWTELSKILPNKTARHCRKRYNITLNDKLKRGNWTTDEDQQVVELVMKHGEKWAKIANEMPGRTADQIRGRYLVSLNPTNNTAAWTSEEYKILLNTHYKLGNQWVAIAKHLPGRQNKFISNHFKESVARKVEIFVSAKGKQNFGQLTEEEVDELIGYLHIKVAGAMKPLLKGAGSRKSQNNLEKTQMSGSKRKRSSALLAASLTEGSSVLGPSSSSSSSGGSSEHVYGDAPQYERLLDGSVSKVFHNHKLKSDDGNDSSDDSVDDLLASLDDARAATSSNRLDKPKYVKTNWSPNEDELLKEMFAKHREKPQKWRVISVEFNKASQEGAFKDETQCERRWRSMPFTAEDDAMIMELARTVGRDGITWKEVAKKILGHSGTQCQERWIKLSTVIATHSHHVPVESEPILTEFITSEHGVNEASIEIIPVSSDAVVGKFKKAKLATKAVNLPESEIRDAQAIDAANKAKLKIKSSSSAIVDDK